MTSAEKIDAIYTMVVNIEKRMASLTVQAAARSAPSGEVAHDSDLDSQYGDPIVKKDPKDWKGDSFAGCNYSGCPPEYLDMLAGLKMWQAKKDAEKGTPEGAKYADYSRRDAARALGWAKRLRSGWTAPTPIASIDADGADIPF